MKPASRTTRRQRLRAGARQRKRIQEEVSATGLPTSEIPFFFPRAAASSVSWFVGCLDPPHLSPCTSPATRDPPPPSPASGRQGSTSSSPGLPRGGPPPAPQPPASSFVLGSLRHRTRIRPPPASRPPVSFFSTDGRYRLLPRARKCAGGRLPPGARLLPWHEDSGRPPPSPPPIGLRPAMAAGTAASPSPISSSFLVKLDMEVVNFDCV
ncbi:hypothetical protein BRADI_4g10072v3 [Brachypodium distachyon]|uniref:Uncharacterized protein n=1 Tax=Brachypodium distachyon TaxID=15368 RepID=A0A2K2CLR2_BRADI|nr:hypothetical protein BRADI_4g10072v3 [Brachypodium distachyon]